MNKKTWIIFIVVCVAIFAALIAMSQSKRIDVSNIDTSKVQPASDASGNIADQLAGNKDATVTLIEYGDFQCPSCEGAYPNIKSILDEYGDDVRFIYRNFPITSAHPNALAAAAAAEAAGLQGKYWEMHNYIFENKSEWANLSVEQRTDKFTDYAIVFRLDEDKFVKDMASERVSQKVAFDKALAGKDGVSGTPTFFLNGKELTKEMSNDVVQQQGNLLKKAIEEAIKSTK